MLIKLKLKMTQNMYCFLAGLLKLSVFDKKNKKIGNNVSQQANRNKQKNKNVVIKINLIQREYVFLF